jgi:hypothetical protein
MTPSPWRKTVFVTVEPNGGSQKPRRHADATFGPITPDPFAGGLVAALDEDEL